MDDFKFALRKDPKKLARVEELLFMAEVIARARGKDDFAQYADEETKGTGAGATGPDEGKDKGEVGGKQSKGKAKAKS